MTLPSRATWLNVVSLSRVSHLEEIAETVGDEATIFAQCLIALRKLNPNTITLWFDETIGENDVKSTDTKVKPYYTGDEPEVGKGLAEVPVNVDQAMKDAGDFSFGYTEDSAW